MVKSGIYIIRCSKSIKVYIGSAINLKHREFQHFSILKRNKHQAKLQNAFNKYGESAFTFEVLEYVEDKTKLIEREQHYLDTILFAQQYIRKEDKRFLQLSFNIYPTAISPLGYKWTKQQSLNKSKYQTGLKHKKHRSSKHSKKHILKRSKCKYCKKLFTKQSLSMWHNDYCLKNPNAIKRRKFKKAKCNNCGFVSSVQIIGRFHNQNCKK